MASTADLEAQILAEMEADPEAYAETEIEYLVIDNDLRTISIPSGVKSLGAESDKDVHRLYFQIPKVYGEFDLSTFDIRVNYKNGNVGDSYIVDDKAVEGDVITFSWLIGRNAVKTKGTTQFIVCLKKSDANGVVQQEFNTTLASLNVLEGLETTEQVVQENPDVIEQILKKIEGFTEISPEDIASAVQEYMQANPITADKVSYTAPVGFGADNVQEAINLAILWVFEEIDNMRTQRIEQLATDTTVELQPGRLYVFPEMASLTLTLTVPEDTTIVNEYHCIFASGATATILTLPDTIKIPDGFTVDANKVYELSVLESCLSYMSWEVTA